MTKFDFSPFNAITVGFDNMLDTLSKVPSFPPYNIEKVEDGRYKMSFAIAGYEKPNVEVKIKDNKLTVRGVMPKSEDDSKFVWKGIAERPFTSSFKLADYMNVISADMKNGILSIELEQEIPEDKKERYVEIS